MDFFLATLSAARVSKHDFFVVRASHFDSLDQPKIHCNKIATKNHMKAAKYM